MTKEGFQSEPRRQELPELPEPFGALIREIKDGSLVKQWAKLSYIQRTRLRLFVEVFYSAIKDIEQNHMPPWEVGRIDPDWRILFTKKTRDERKETKQSYKYSLVLEHYRTHRQLSRLAHKIAESKGLNPNAY